MRAPALSSIRFVTKKQASWSLRHGACSSLLRLSRKVYAEASANRVMLWKPVCPKDPPVRRRPIAAISPSPAQDVLLRLGHASVTLCSL